MGQWLPGSDCTDQGPEVTNKRPWSIAELTAMVDQGRLIERKRIMNLLIDNKVLRIDALGSLVFVNCDTLEVEYLQGLTGEQK